MKKTLFIADPEYGWDHGTDEDGEWLDVPYLLIPSGDDPYEHLDEVEIVRVQASQVRAPRGGIGLDETATAIEKSDSRIRQEGFEKAEWYAIAGIY